MKIWLRVSSVWYSLIRGSSQSRNKPAASIHDSCQLGRLARERGQAGRNRDLFGQVVRRAAHREVAVGQPGSAGLLEQIENDLPLAEGVQERAERPQVEAVRPHPDQVAGDAAHFGR